MKSLQSVYNHAHLTNVRSLKTQNKTKHTQKKNYQGAHRKLPEMTC